MLIFISIVYYSVQYFPVVSGLPLVLYRGETLFIEQYAQHDVVS